MLTAPATFPIATGGPTQQAEPFKEMCDRFCAEKTQNGLRFIKTEEQSQIYETIKSLAPFSSTATPITPTTMVQWVQTLVRCLPGEILGNLLRETAQTILSIHASFNLEQYNLEQLATILNHLTGLLYSQALHQQLYFEGDPTSRLNDVVPTLRVLILKIIAIGKNGTLLSPTQVSIVLSALGRSAFVLTDEETDEAFTVLAEQIRVNTSQQHSFSDGELKEVFWGLRYCQEKNSQPLEILMQALLQPLQNAKMGRLIDGTLSYVIYNLKNSRSNASTMAILENATMRINAYAAAKLWIPADCISQIFAGLARMGANAVTEALLTSLLPHLDQFTNLKQPDGTSLFSLSEIGMILEGLQRFEHSTTALSILQRLTAQLTLPFYVELKAINLEKWLAHTIYSLSSYLDETASPEAQSYAMAFINTAVNKLELGPTLQEKRAEFTAEDLSKQADRESLILEIGNFTDSWAAAVDLSGYKCSRAFVQFIAEFISQMERDGETEKPVQPPPVYFNYDDDEPGRKAWYESDEIEWIRAIFAEFFAEGKEKNISLRSTLSISSAASSASPAEQGSTENVTAAASP